MEPFLEAIIEGYLYIAAIYPGTVFERKDRYAISTYSLICADIKKYVKLQLEDIVSWIRQGKIARLMIVVDRVSSKETFVVRVSQSEKKYLRKQRKSIQIVLQNLLRLCRAKDQSSDTTWNFLLETKKNKKQSKLVENCPYGWKQEIHKSSGNTSITPLGSVSFDLNRVNLTLEVFIETSVLAETVDLCKS